MGYDDGHIILDSANGAYFAGQTINGRIAFDQSKQKTIHGIKVSIKGFCKVHWTTESTRTVEGREEKYTIHHEANEEYLNKEKFLFGNQNGEYHLQSGHHEFNFEFQIPNNSPSSFEGTYGHIRYRIKAKMLTTGIFSSNKEKTLPINVITPLDLNSDPRYKEPLEMDLSQSYCCWCFNRGSSEIRVKLPVSAYCPGQLVSVDVAVNNPSMVEIDQVKVALRKDLKFIAQHEPGERVENELIRVEWKGPIPAGATQQYTMDLQLPQMDVYNLTMCRYIEFHYFLEVSTEVSGCHNGTEETHPIIIGTIPIMGFQDNIPNPLQSKLPQILPQSPPITTQPMNSPYGTQPAYPQNQPYPGANQQYPNANQQYPNANQQYPNASQPYPGNNQPNQPYPGNNQPNQQYPGNNLQYPGVNQPNQQYPGNNQPYPGNNQPYPGNNQPYPDVNQQYPANNQQYPGVNPPNQQYPGGHPLAQPTFGFTAPGDAHTPLLPPGTNPPIPN